MSQSVFLLSEVPKLQIVPILCFPGLSPLLVDYVFDLLWNGVLSTLVMFEYAPSFQIEEFVDSVEVTHFPQINVPVCSRIPGVGRLWFIVYLTVFPDYQVSVFLLFKLVLTTIVLGEILSNIPFLTGKAFIYRNEKYMMLLMSIL